MSPESRPDFADDPRWAALLAPVRPDAPCGSDIRGSAAYADIKEALREDDEGDMGVWQRVRKTADWPLASRLCQTELTRNSKDLQVAAWWLLAETKLRAFDGLTQGLRLIEELIERYWEGLYPPLEDGDTVLRTVPLEWIAGKMESHLRQIPLTRAGHGWYRLKETQTVPPEADTAEDDRKRQQRQDAIAEGKLTPEEFQEGLRATPASFWERAFEQVDSTNACLGRLTARCEELCTEDPPTFSRLTETLAELTHAMRSFAGRRNQSGPASAPAPPRQAAPVRETPNAGDPFAEFDEPAEPEPSPSDSDPFAVDSDEEGEEEFAAEEEEAEAEAEAEADSDPPPKKRSSPRREDPMDEPAGFDAALKAHAAGIRERDPASPASYMLARGLRWGELRGAGLDPLILAAPPPAVRRALKELRQAEEWRELLEESERAAAAPWGRAWLDPHAYTLQACGELGGEFAAVHDAIAGELARLLADFPALPDSFLEDDTPCANAATREFLSQLPQPAGAPRPGGAPEPLYNGRDARATAADLQRRLRRQTHGRGRFHYRVRLAERLAQDGKDTPALALLRDLLKEIGDRRLVEWEKAEDLAIPVRLLCETAQRAGEEPDAMTIQLLASLDPLAAAELF